MNVEFRSRWFARQVRPVASLIVLAVSWSLFLEIERILLLAERLPVSTFLLRRKNRGWRGHGSGSLSLMRIGGRLIVRREIPFQ